MFSRETWSDLISRRSCGLVGACAFPQGDVGGNLPKDSS